MLPLLGGKSVLASDLPLLQRLLVIGVMLPGQMPLPLRREIAVFQLPGAALITLAQTPLPQETALAVPLIRQIDPVQPAGAAVE